MQIDEPVGVAYSVRIDLFLEIFLACHDRIPQNPAAFPWRGLRRTSQDLEKAEYGSNILNRLSADLSARYGKGFSRGNIFYMRKLYLTYQKVQTLSELLTWSHYVELLKLEDPLERSFYE